MTATFHATAACRICGSNALALVVDLGDQALTGVFPRDRATAETGVTKGPLRLVQCEGECGLVQLGHTYDPSEMYGENYGYRSSLNRAMVDHLRRKVEGLVAQTALGAGDVVLDVGSNDGTTLSFYPEAVKPIGIDPTAAKFAKYYQPRVTVVPDFFTAETFLRASGGARAKIVTSIAMFYDLERPLDFVKDVHEVLADGGIWHFEQSYLPSMLAATSYDTICHEHVEYYRLAPIRWMLDRVGFSIVDVSFNDVNGGSFAITARKSRPGAVTHAPIVDEILARESAAGLATLDPLSRFAEATDRHRVELRRAIDRLRGDGKRVAGMGASTKGNVILQYCGLGPDRIDCIAEVNDDKFGCFTPGTAIPIVSEADALARSPDWFLVLPWHFRAGIVKRSDALFARKIGLIFPLPSLELVSA
jgi:NDP-4-keto-2,6-dideoxyhexose 3-C-methyltransferase